MPYRTITGIYIIKNLINGKVYIGSAKSILSRINTHKYKLLKNDHFNKHLQSSFNKYGFNNFEFSILEITTLDKKILQEKEEFYIRKFKSNNRLFGFNKRINCETNLGKKLTKEHIEKLKISHLGNKRSKEAHEKIIRSQYKRVFKINSEKEIVSEYESIIEAAEKNGLLRQAISACCRNKLNSTGGYYWCFVNDYNGKEFGPMCRNRGKQTKYIYLNTITGETFFKLKDVSNILGIHKSNLCNMFSGKLKNNTIFVRHEEK